MSSYTNFAALELAMVLFLGGNHNLSAQAREPHSTSSVKGIATVVSRRALVRFTTQERLRFFEESTFTPLALAGPVTGAALSQWVTNSPPEWGQGFPGYGRRVWSGFSRQVIANTLGLGVSVVDREDPRHYQTGRRGIWKRGLDAAGETFVSHKLGGSYMPDYSRFIGCYGAAFIANAWYPARESNTKGALYRGSTALASNMVWQLFEEFWPDVRRKLRGH